MLGLHIRSNAFAWSLDWQSDSCTNRSRSRYPWRLVHVDQEGASIYTTHPLLNGDSVDMIVMSCIGGMLTMCYPGCRRPKAPREEPQGQGRKVPSHSHRIENPPSQQILQDCRCLAADLEIVRPYSFLTSYDYEDLINANWWPANLLPLPPWLPKHSCSLALRTCSRFLRHHGVPIQDYQGVQSRFYASRFFISNVYYDQLSETSVSPI
jgi:hypothetical protein